MSKVPVVVEVLKKLGFRCRKRRAKQSYVCTHGNIEAVYDIEHDELKLSIPFDAFVGFEPPLGTFTETFETWDEFTERFEKHGVHVYIDVPGPWHLVFDVDNASKKLGVVEGLAKWLVETHFGIELVEPAPKTPPYAKVYVGEKIVDNPEEYEKLMKKFEELASKTKA